MKVNIYFLILSSFFIYHISYSQNTCTFNDADGNANDDGNWDCVGPGSLTNPEDAVAADLLEVIIPSSKKVNIKFATYWDGNVTIQDGGILEIQKPLVLGAEPSGTCVNNLTITIEDGGTLNGKSSSANEILTVCNQVLINKTGVGSLFSWDDFPPSGIAGPAIVDDTGGTLPVELTSFTANTTDESVALSWATASEQNNDYFTLERSKDGRRFEVIGKVEGQGTTTVTSNYSFTDQSPYLGLSFYRLSQTDFDGAFEIFPAISVVFTSNSNTFSINPNPIKNQSVTLKVSGRAKNELLDLKIIDLQGRLIETTHFRADQFGNLKTEIQLKKQLRQGTYIFELSSGNYKEYLKVVSK